MAAQDRMNRSSEEATGAAVPHRVLVVVGPSASGKSSVVRELHRRQLVRVHPTWTTRPRRDDERDGSFEHRFVSDAVFDELRARGFFLGTAALPGLSHRYGLASLLAASGGPVDAVILRAQFVERVARAFPRQLVYQIEDTVERAEQRLLLRGCTAAEVAARLDEHHGEIAAGRRVAHRVIVNDRPVSALVDVVSAALRRDLTQGTVDQGELAP